MEPHHLQLMKDFFNISTNLFYHLFRITIYKRTEFLLEIELFGNLRRVYFISYFNQSHIYSIFSMCNSSEIERTQ